MRVPKTLTFEMRLFASLSVEDEFYVHEIILKKDYHIKQWFYIQPHFETESWGNSHQKWPIDKWGGALS